MKILLVKTLDDSPLRSVAMNEKSRYVFPVVELSSGIVKVYIPSPATASPLLRPNGMYRVEAAVVVHRVNADNAVIGSARSKAYASNILKPI